jgi:hypothetical protein
MGLDPLQLETGFLGGDVFARIGRVAETGQDEYEEDEAFLKSRRYRRTTDVVESGGMGSLDEVVALAALEKSMGVLKASTKIPSSNDAAVKASDVKNDVGLGIELILPSASREAESKLTAQSSTSETISHPLQPSTRTSNERLDHIDASDLQIDKRSSVQALSSIGVSKGLAELAGMKQSAFCILILCWWSFVETATPNSTPTTPEPAASSSQSSSPSSVIAASSKNAHIVHQKHPVPLSQFKWELTQRPPVVKATQATPSSLGSTELALSATSPDASVIDLTPHLASIESRQRQKRNPNLEKIGSEVNALSIAKPPPLPTKMTTTTVTMTTASLIKSSSTSSISTTTTKFAAESTEPSTSYEPCPCLNTVPNYKKLLPIWTADYNVPLNRLYHILFAPVSSKADSDPEFFNVPEEDKSFMYGHMTLAKKMKELVLPELPSSTNPPNTRVVK